MQLTLAAVTVVAALSLACADKPAPPPQQAPASPASPAPATSATTPSAPDSFRVAFQTSRGTFTVEILRAWAPLGADRFYDLVNQHFFDQTKFFRVVPGFVAQFGLSADPKRNEPWDSKLIRDDPVTQSNKHGTLTFASQGANTRTHQLFLNLVDNARLDGMGFSPIGRVVDGLAVVDSLYSGYGEGPDQTYIESTGNAYLDRTFPKLDYIKTARIVTR
ncbi:MAG: peptidylprolyl isomerase [Gemmatimonadaceae bacterium]